MSLKNIVFKTTNRLSLHERFSFLNAQKEAESSSQNSSMVQVVRQGLFNHPAQASLKNQRLAQMMDRRPTVIAALRLKKRILKQRLGERQGRPVLSVKERLSLRGRLRGNSLRGRVGQRSASEGRSPLIRPSPRQRGRGGPSGRRPRGNFNRDQSQTNLSRSQSLQTIDSKWPNIRRGGRDSRPESRQSGRFQTNRPDFRSHDRFQINIQDSRSNGRFQINRTDSRSSGRFQNRNRFNGQEFRGGRGRGLRSRGGSVNRNQDDFQGRSGVGGGGFDRYRSQRTRGFRGGMGRGSVRGRGGVRGRGSVRGRGGGRGPPPTREELDSQLDQYMAGSRGMLDRELDSYMINHESWD